MVRRVKNIVLSWFDVMRNRKAPGQILRRVFNKLVPTLGRARFMRSLEDSLSDQNDGMNR